jgi:uncharacterized protein (TIGR02466 family)
MNIKKHNLSSLDYYWGQISEIDNKKLKKYIIENSIPFSLDETDTRIEDTKLLYNETIKKIENQIIQDYFIYTGLKIKAYEFWSHIHEKNHSTNVHNHGSPYNMSAVYYVSTPKNSGKFVFQFKINDSIDNRMFINPIESHYILFPSSINHFVTRNNSDDLRISLSFNFTNE